VRVGDPRCFASLAPRRAEVMEIQGTASDRQRRGYLVHLAFVALGVVFGDIGTSPLYAIRECFTGEYGVPPTQANVLGVLSLIVWALILVISVKYLVFILYADNRGEGGILALMALLRPERSTSGGTRATLIVLGLFGAALLYGDGMITPAISVLSAVEGLHVATSFFDPYVVPITLAILLGLFLVQHRGTRGVGTVFAPVSLVWFVVLAVLGLRGIARAPGVLLALNPVHGWSFFVDNGWRGFLVLGAVFLVVTGGEALYADMGHFGRAPIRLAWFALVLPALLLNYFGQGALLLAQPETAHNPFYRLAPIWAHYPMVLLSTLATIIASQAVISGSFSLTRQAVQLGYSPRLEIDHTSPREIGQIYVPLVNWVLMFCTIALVLGFRTSSRLAAAYGVAVTTTMGITTLLFYVLARQSWGWSAWKAGALAGVFLVVDLSFFFANIIKIEHGGWFPLVIAGAVFTLMSTWKRGRGILYRRIGTGLAVEQLLDDIAAHPPIRVPGTAVFMTANPEGVPHCLLHNLKHNKVLHERVVFLTVAVDEIPHVPRAERLEITLLGNGAHRILARYGFMQNPSVPEILAQAGEMGLVFDPMQTTFFLGRENLIPTDKPGMALWRERLFAFMSRNGRAATAFFDIPPNRVVELGQQVEL
jgi:KUP system potassium uptake protein